MCGVRAHLSRWTGSPRPSPPGPEVQRRQSGALGPGSSHLLLFMVVPSGQSFLSPVMFTEHMSWAELWVLLHVKRNHMNVLFLRVKNL